MTVNLLQLFLYSKVLGSLKIMSSTAGISSDISDLTSLNTIHTIRSLEITDNNNLTNLNGLNRVKTIEGTLILKNNSTLNSLSSLSGLNNFYFLSGEFTIEKNEALLSLDGLQNISSLLSYTINIINNDALVSISNINMDPEEIIIENNDVLNDFCALSNLFSTGTFGFSYSVSGNEYNPNLQSIADANNCSSLSVSNVFNEQTVIYPNPTTGVLNIQTAQDVKTVEVYSIQGQKLALYTNSKILDVKQLPQGLCFLKITDNLNRTQSVKFVKN